jgi:hypothetical protein
MRWWADVSGADAGSPPKTVVLVLTHDEAEGGYFLAGFDGSGAETLSTWHGGMRDAREWAATQHAPADVGPWVEIPREVSDATSHALRAAKRPSQRGRPSRDIRAR